MTTQDEIMKMLADQQQRQAILSRNMAYANPNWQQQMAKLNPQQEQAFLQWVSQNKVPVNPNDKTPDYDMRGYWLSLQNAQAAKAGINPNTGTLHFPDTFKTPYHESFSAESKWATKGAPTWKEDKLVAPDGKVVFQDKPGK